jgi:hypothetical protein
MCTYTVGYVGGSGISEMLKCAKNLNAIIRMCVSASIKIVPYYSLGTSGGAVIPEIFKQAPVGKNFEGRALIER